MSTRLRVLAPCHESWDRMKPVDNGRHCDHCNKVVVDLSECTEAEALARVSGGGRHCIRMRVDAAGVPTFAGAALASALALAACDGVASDGTNAGTAGASSQSAVIPPVLLTRRASARANSNAFIAGDMAPSVDVEWASLIAIKEVRNSERWQLVTADAVPAATEDDRVQWIVRVRRVDSYSSSGEPRFAADPAIRFEIGYFAEVVSRLTEG